MKWLRNMALNFLVRVITGVLIIFLVNQYLVTEEIELSVGINPVTVITAGTLGAPGVCLLYGIMFFEGVYTL